MSSVVLCFLVVLAIAWQVLNLSGENGSAAVELLVTARGGWAVEVGPLRLLVVPPG
jgi:hypothetical protein